MQDGRTTIRLPARLGPYALEAELGSGAMAAVYRACHTGLGRECALKVFDPSVAVGACAERFRREAQAAARLGRHPHIVAVHDVGEAEGLLYIAMELVRGQDLSCRVEAKGPLPEPQAFELALKVAFALDHAHRFGLIHRDLKPSNIILDAAGEPHITDFGIALDVMSEGLTSDGQILGTPSYMAPEQARNARESIGPETDVYALGATLFEILSGRPPFVGSTLGILTEIILRGPPRLRSVHPGCSAAADGDRREGHGPEDARPLPVGAGARPRPPRRARGRARVRESSTGRSRRSRPSRAGTRSSSPRSSSPCARRARCPEPRRRSRRSRGRASGGFPRERADSSRSSPSPDGRCPRPSRPGPPVSRVKRRSARSPGSGPAVSFARAGRERAPGWGWPSPSRAPGGT